MGVGGSRSSSQVGVGRCGKRGLQQPRGTGPGCSEQHKEPFFFSPLVKRSRVLSIQKQVKGRCQLEVPQQKRKGPQWSGVPVLKYIHLGQQVTRTRQKTAGGETAERPRRQEARAPKPRGDPGLRLNAAYRAGPPSNSAPPSQDQKHPTQGQKEGKAKQNSAHHRAKNGASRAPLRAQAGPMHGNTRPQQSQKQGQNGTTQGQYAAKAGQKTPNTVPKTGPKRHHSGPSPSHKARGLGRAHLWSG